MTLAHAIARILRMLSHERRIPQGHDECCNFESVYVTGGLHVIGVWCLDCDSDATEYVADRTVVQDEGSRWDI